MAARVQPWLIATNRPVVLEQGDLGVVVKPDGRIMMLAPAGSGDLSPMHQALAGAAVGTTMDVAFREKALSTFSLYFTMPGEAGVN